MSTALPAADAVKPFAPPPRRTADDPRSELAAIQAVAEFMGIRSEDVDWLSGKFAAHEASAKRAMWTLLAVTAAGLALWTWAAGVLAHLDWHGILPRAGLAIADPTLAAVAGIVLAALAFALAVLGIDRMAVAAGRKDARNDTGNLNEAIDICRDKLKAKLEDNTAPRPPATAALDVGSAVRAFDRIKLEALFYDNWRLTAADAAVGVVLLGCLPFAGRRLLDSGWGVADITAFLAWLAVAAVILWRYAASRRLPRIDVGRIERALDTLFECIATRLYYFRLNAQFLAPGTHTFVGAAEPRAPAMAGAS